MVITPQRDRRFWESKFSHLDLKEIFANTAHLTAQQRVNYLFRYFKIVGLDTEGILFISDNLTDISFRGENFFGEYYPQSRKYLGVEYEGLLIIHSPNRFESIVGFQKDSNTLVPISFFRVPGIDTEGSNKVITHTSIEDAIQRLTDELLNISTNF